MNYVVRRGGDGRAPEGDVLEERLAEAWDEAARHFVLDGDGTDSTVYLAVQEHDDLFLPANSILARIENEVLEESINNGEVPLEAVRGLINGLVPAPGAQMTGVLEVSSTVSGRTLNVQINQQIVNTVEGTVIQSVQGTVHLGAEAQQLLEIIGRHASDDRALLESSVYELEDPDARKEDRLNAKQRLKGFMAKVGSRLQDVAVAALVKYLDSKLGL